MDGSAHLFAGMNSQLYVAAEEGNVLKLNKILEAKLNIFQDLSWVSRIVGKPPLPSRKGYVEDDNYLRLQNREGNIALHEAAKGGNYKVVEVLLKHSHDHNLTSVSNREGEIAVFIASQRGHTDIVKRLLPFMDFNRYMKRHGGQTALDYVIISNLNKKKKMLLLSI
ncbi:uncharacterized protein LOC131859345 [Cryptomeria japonica]|uniref:uncharacterized protein LOC131859345 n=1 Tax=Cryptomeria japonica TaxID=3369 RepID=UPI0027DA4817|nr:uncharacterized protein LOC131859345 [Cryptomeria japonica]